LIGPVGENDNQKYIQIDKLENGKIIRKELFSVRFRQLN
jgi:protein-L-isoaspartate O-methyltransferase